MDKAFSRWPSQSPPTGQAGFFGLAPELPPWMLAPLRNPWPERFGHMWATITVVLLPVGLAFFAGLLFMKIGGAAISVGVLSILAVVYAAIQTVKGRHALAMSAADSDAFFERAGISMWRENWSAVGEEVSSLRRRGVVDLEAYFATRPDDLRALCAKVMIEDVNTFTVEETGAPGKHAFVGPLDRIIPHTDQTIVQWLVAFAQGDRFFRSEAHIIRPDGSEIDVLFTAALPIDLEGFERIIVTSLDITSFKAEQGKLLAADAEIARVSRFSTVGALGASIAHEVNSPLAAVVANGQAALRWLRRPAPNIIEAIEAVDALIVDATRAKEVVKRTRAFVSNAPVTIAAFDVVAAAREANLLVERELRSRGAAVHLHAETGLPLVIGDVIQIQQVFTNLLLNAAQAMVGQDAVKDITVSFRTDGVNIRIDIADTGSGIEPQKLERVFDPFYTTRPDGMGMGLAICRNCIDAQGGNIWASNGHEHGATIHFTLPIHNG